jgi:hypothetical protein
MGALNSDKATAGGDPLLTPSAPAWIEQSVARVGTPPA